MIRRFLGFLLLVALAAGVFLVLRPPPIPPPIVLHPTPRQAAQARRHIEGLREQIFAPDRPGPRTIRVSEEDLNIYLATNPPLRKLLASSGVGAVQITLQEPAGLTLRAAVRANGQPQNFQLEGALAPDPQLGLRFTASHAQVGRFPLPAGVVSGQANALAARFVHQMPGRLPLMVQNVQVRGKQLILICRPITQRSAASPQ